MDVDVVIRCAVDSDVQELAALAEQTFPLATPQGTSIDDIAEFIGSNLSVDNFLSHMADPHVRVVVAQAASANDVDARSTVAGLVGYALLVSGPDGAPDPTFGVTSQPSAYLSKFYVAQHMHGGSVSAPLMETVCQVAATELQVSSVWLAVSQVNTRAGRFYEKSGFARVGVKKMHVGSQIFDDFVYERVL